MTSDFHRSKAGRFTVAVSWLPEKDPNGEFVCQVILDERWDHPLEEMRTRDPKKMTAWTFAQMREAIRRGGPNGEESQNLR